MFGKADETSKIHFGDTLLGWTGLAHYFRANNKATPHCSARAIIEHFLYFKFNFTFPAELHMVFSEINTV